MSITQRQFKHLNEMGIMVWKHRNSDNKSNTSNDIASKYITSPTIMPINQQCLIEDLFFIDVLISVNLSVGDVNISNDTVDLGLFNWQFIQSEQLSFANSVLYTPEINVLKSNIKLKRTLWHIIQQEVLS